MGVPDLQRPHLREAGHRLAVGGHRGHRRCAGVGLREAVVARRDREARRHPLHVVLERPGQGLVEVVEVEHELALGGGEGTEVRQMRVTAQLRVQPGRRRGLEVRRHDPGGAPVEGERRGHHPAVPDRHQVLFPGAVLFVQQRDRIGAVRRRSPAGVAVQRRVFPRLPAMLRPAPPGSDVRCAERSSRLRLLGLPSSVRVSPRTGSSGARAQGSRPLGVSLEWWLGLLAWPPTRRPEPSPSWTLTHYRAGHITQSALLAASGSTTYMVR